MNLTMINCSFNKSEERQQVKKVEEKNKQLTQLTQHNSHNRHKEEARENNSRCSLDTKSKHKRFTDIREEIRL